jgi:hypothetical protein
VRRQKSAGGMLVARPPCETDVAGCTGGLSTGPKTPEGIERIRRAKTKHGLYSAAAIAERQRFRAMFKDCREVLFAAKRVFWEKANSRVGPEN